MAQEADAEPVAEMRAFDKSRNVGDRKALLVRDEHPSDIGRERRERVGGYFGARGAQRGEQRRLAGVGKSDQAGLGDQPELQPRPSLLAGAAGSRDSRRAPRRGGEVHIAAAARAAVRDHLALGRPHEIGDHRAIVAVAVVEDHRARRHFDHQVFTGAAVLILAAAGSAVARDQPRLVLEVQQRGHALVDLEDHVAAAPAVAAGGAAEGPVLFAQECDRTVAALAGVHEDSGLVDESHRPEVIIAGWPAPLSRFFRADLRRPSPALAMLARPLPGQGEVQIRRSVERPETWVTL